MKLAFTELEVARALGLSREEFLESIVSLEANGFPKPLPGLKHRWAIVEVIRWVNRDMARNLAHGPHSAPEGLDGQVLN